MMNRWNRLFKLNSHVLRLLCCAAALCGAPLLAQTKWQVLTYNLDKTVTIWMDSASVKRRGDFVYVWVIYDRKVSAPDGAMSSKAFNQYDCANQEARTWQQSFFTESMAGGTRLSPKAKAQCEAGDELNPVLDEACAQTWKPIVPNTTGADILMALCLGRAA